MTETDSESGFTLIESLVALSLVALIALVAFVGLRLGHASWARTERHSQLASEVTTAQRFLRQAIEQAYPGPVVSPGAAPAVTFRGSPTALELAAPVPRDLAVGGRHRLFIWHSAVDDLTIAWAPERGQGPSASPPADAQRAILLAGVRAVTFTYFGQAKGEPQARWHRDWVDQRALPQLVRMEARLADGSAARWPILDVAPRLQVDAGCVLDVLSRNCRGR